MWLNLARVSSWPRAGDVVVVAERINRRKLTSLASLSSTYSCDVRATSSIEEERKVSVII